MSVEIYSYKDKKSGGVSSGRYSSESAARNVASHRDADAYYGKSKDWIWKASQKYEIVKLAPVLKLENGAFIMELGWVNV